MDKVFYEDSNNLRQKEMCLGKMEDFLGEGP